MTQPTGDKPYTTKPTSQTDLEERVKRDFMPTATKVDPNAVDDRYAVEDNDTSDYIGVSPEYMTYANETEAPLTGNGVEDKVAAEQLSGYSYGEQNVDQPGGGQTAGGGSQAPVVGAVTSGESVETKVVDPAVESTTVKSEPKATPTPTASPTSTTTTPTSSGPTPTSTS